MSEVYPRRNCAWCTRWRLAVDYRWRWRKRRTKWKGMPSRAKTPSIDNVCQWCRTKASNARYALMTPEQKREKGRKANEDRKLREQKAKEQLLRAKRAYNLSKAGKGDLDLIPFRMWLLGKARQEGGAKAIARQLEMDARGVERWLHGYDWDNDPGWGGWAKCEPRPIRTISLATVDEVGVRLGEPDLLDRLYPFAEE